jgi:lipopolysaccharide export system protein LptC
LPIDGQARSQAKPGAAAARAQRRLGFAGFASVAALVGAVGLLGVFLWQSSVLAPPAPQQVKSADVVEKPDQITSEKAEIAGIDQNNKPYNIKAEAGEQDKAQAHLLHMTKVTSEFERPNGAKLDVTSDTGLYDRNSKTLALTGQVLFKEGTRFAARMDKADINTQDQSLTSRSAVTVDMQGTMIEAGSLSVAGNGTRILFQGGVKARFKMGEPTVGDNK